MKKYLVMDTPDHKILYGTARDIGDGKSKLTGRKIEDATVEILKIAFEWFYKHERDNNHRKLRFEGMPYTLELIKDNEQEDEVKTEDETTAFEVLE